MQHAAWAAPRPSATVYGNVAVKRLGVSTVSMLKSNDQLYAGDVVVTSANSKAGVRFKDGSQLELNSGTALEIASNSAAAKDHVLCRILQGKLTARLRPGIAVASRTALMRVRGTEFMVDVADDGTTTVVVIEGSVEIVNPCGNVIVLQSNQSSVQPGSKPSAPSPVPNLAPLLEWRKELDNILPPDANAIPPHPLAADVGTPTVPATASPPAPVGGIGEATAAPK